MLSKSGWCGWVGLAVLWGCGATRPGTPSGGEGGAGADTATSPNSAEGGNDGEPTSGGAGADGTVAGSAGSGGSGPLGERRLPLPCTAPLPIGFCLVSDAGDYIGQGKIVTASGEGSVSLTSNYGNGVSLSITDDANDDEWSVDFVAPHGARLVPGLYEPATRFPFQDADVAGLSVSGNGAGCNELSGKFSIEELRREPGIGITHFSATFEQHCEGATPALRGVINYQATGEPDPTPVADAVITLSGKIARVAYDAGSHIAYGIDATNRRLAAIDLASGQASYEDVVQVPNDICVDPVRERLFVVNKGSSLLSEYRTSDLGLVRDIAWAGSDWGPTDTHFKIYCSADRLYVVDGAWEPALFTVDGLDTDSPTVTDHSEQVAGVGGLALDAAATNLYYWRQVGWSAGLLSTSVHRLSASDLSELDTTAANVPSFNRDPLDAPILLDESRGIVFNKNKVFDSTNLEKVIYTLPSTFDTFDGADENAFALFAEGGRLSSKNFIYELERYQAVAETLDPTADQLFFDASGTLWYLSRTKGTLESQVP